MGSFEILFIIAGVVLAIPVLVAIVDIIAEMAYHVHRHMRPRTTHAQRYCRDMRRAR